MPSPTSHTYARVGAGSDDDDTEHTTTSSLVQKGSLKAQHAASQHAEGGLAQKGQLPIAAPPSPPTADLISLDDDDGGLYTPQSSGIADMLSSPTAQQPSSCSGSADASATTQKATASEDEAYGTVKPDKPMLDFEEEDNAVIESRELLIYALPLIRDQLVYLPVTSWTDAPPEYTGIRGKIQEKLDVMQAKAQEAWESAKGAEPGTMKHKAYEAGRRVVEGLSPEQRLLRNIPKNVTKIIIRHPATISPDVIMEELTRTTATAGLNSTSKATVAGLMLPLAFGVDMIVLPGPAVLTYFTLFKLYTNTSVAAGGQRLTAYIAQDGKSNNVRVNYAGDERLNKYLEWVSDLDAGVLEEEQIESLCEELKEPQLLQPLIELRARHLRQNTTTKFNTEYKLLSAQTPGGPS